jgi:hypothetical protein
MTGAVPVRDYAGAAIVFSVAAILASFVILSPLDTGRPGFRWTETLFRNAQYIGVAGVSAAVSSYLLRPVARRLAAHQYFLRPFIMGCAVVVVAHLLFGLIVSPILEGSSALTRDDYRFEIQRFFAGVYLLSVGGLFACVITVPVGILAAYCVEIVGWIREDACRRRNSVPMPDDQAGAAE